MTKKCENRVRKPREFCVQFVHVFLIWRIRWRLKIPLICTCTKSVISSHLRGKWWFGPPEFTFFASFYGMPSSFGLDLWGGDYRGGAYTVSSKEDSTTECSHWFSIARIENQWKIDVKLMIDQYLIGILIKTNRDFDHTSIGYSKTLSMYDRTMDFS